MCSTSASLWVARSSDKLVTTTFRNCIAGELRKNETDEQGDNVTDELRDNVAGEHSTFKSVVDVLLTAFKLEGATSKSEVEVLATCNVDIGGFKSVVDVLASCDEFGMCLVMVGFLLPCFVSRAASLVLI
jgi:hypothetical protein